MHWTQTAEGKKRMRSIGKKAWKTRRENGTASSNAEAAPAPEGIPTQEQTFQNHVAYAFGRTESWLESYASAAGIPGSAFAARVAELLHRKANGEVLRSEDNVFGLRRTPTSRASRSPEMAVAGRPRKNRVYPSSEVAEERYYTTLEVSKMWKLSPDAVRDRFRSEPGVMIIKNPSRGKRVYTTLRIPQSVLERAYKSRGAKHAA